MQARAAFSETLTSKSRVSLRYRCGTANGHLDACTRAYGKLPVHVQTALNKAAAEAMLISASILRLGTSKAVAHGIDDDSRDRIVTSLKVCELPPF